MAAATAAMPWGQPWSRGELPKPFPWEEKTPEEVQFQEQTSSVYSPVYPHPVSKADSVSVVEDDVEQSEPRTDLPGLLDLFERLKREGVILTEVTYVVNYWGGSTWMIPLRHHGFIIRCGPTKEGEDRGYLSLDFGRRGIVWDTYEDYPELPDHTICARKFRIHVDPLSMKIFCQETKPFSWFDHNCELWAHNAMKVMKISEVEGYHPGSDEGRMPGHARPRLPHCAPFAMCTSTT